MDSPKKKAGRPPTGKTSAAKTLGQIRITPEQLECYKAAANSKDEALSAWVRRHLDRAAKRDTKP